MRRFSEGILIFIFATFFVGCDLAPKYKAEVNLKIDGKAFTYTTESAESDVKDHTKRSFYLVRDVNDRKPYVVLRYYLGNPVAKFWLRYDPPGEKRGSEMKKFECYVPPAKPNIIIERELNRAREVQFKLGLGGRYQFSYSKGLEGKCELQKFNDTNQSWEVLPKEKSDCRGKKLLEPGEYRIQFAQPATVKFTVSRLPLKKTDKYWKRNRSFFGEEHCRVTIEKFEKGAKFRLVFDAELTPSRLKKKKGSTTKSKDKEKDKEKKEKEFQNFVQLKGQAVVYFSKNKK